MHTHQAELKASYKIQTGYITKENPITVDVCTKKKPKKSQQLYVYIPRKTHQFLTCNVIEMCLTDEFRNFISSRST